jgi:Arc/MetJ-type ribon-helix-helix transcriptional regulator
VRRRSVVGSVVVAIRLSKALLGAVDDLVAGGMFPSRSAAVRELLVRGLAGYARTELDGIA